VKLVSVLLSGCSDIIDVDFVSKILSSNFLSVYVAVGKPLSCSRNQLCWYVYPYMYTDTFPSISLICTQSLLELAADPSP